VWDCETVEDVAWGVSGRRDLFSAVQGLLKQGLLKQGFKWGCFQVSQTCNNTNAYMWCRERAFRARLRCENAS
jgi:hypothetical protein